MSPGDWLNKQPFQVDTFVAEDLFGAPLFRNGGMTSLSGFSLRHLCRHNPNRARQVPLGKLFSFASRRDTVFMIIGTIAAAVQAW